MEVSDREGRAQRTASDRSTWRSWFPHSLTNNEGALDDQQGGVGQLDPRPQARCCTFCSAHGCETDILPFDHSSRGADGGVRTLESMDRGGTDNSRNECDAAKTNQQKREAEEENKERQAEIEAAAAARERANDERAVRRSCTLVCDRRSTSWTLHTAAAGTTRTARPHWRWIFSLR